MTKTATMIALLALTGCGEVHSAPPALACDGGTPGPVRWFRAGRGESVRIGECQARADVVATAQQRADELGCTVAVAPSDSEWCDYPLHLDLLMRIDGAQDCEALNEAAASPCAMPIWRPLR